MKDRDELKKIIEKNIRKTLAEDGFKLKFQAVVEGYIESMLSTKTSVLMESSQYRELKIKCIEFIKSLVASEGFMDKVGNYFTKLSPQIEKSNYTFSQIFPPGFTNGLKVYIYNNSGKISATAKAFLTQESMSAKIKQQISSMMYNLNPMASKLINPEMIYSKLMASIEQFFDEPNNILDIINQLNNLLDSISQKNVSDFIAGLPNESKSALLKSSAENLIAWFLNEEFITSTIETIEKSMADTNNLYTLLGGFNIDIEMMSKYFVDIYYSNLVKSIEMRNLIEYISGSLADELTGNYLE